MINNSFMLGFGIGALIIGIVALYSKQVYEKEIERLKQKSEVKNE